MPAWLFALHIKAQRVAGIQEFRVSRIVRKSNGIHVHRLDEQHILDVLCLRQRTATLRAERMTIHTLHDDLPTIYKHTVLLIAVVLVTIFDSAEAKLLALYVEGLTLCVFQSKDCCIQVRLFSIPQFRVIGTEFCFSLVAGNDVCRACRHLLAIGVNNINTHLTAWHGTIQEHISCKEAICLRVNGYALDILRRFRDDEHWTPDASEVPIVSTTLSQIYLWVGTLFQHLDLQTILFLAKEHTIRDVNGMSGKAALIRAVTCLTTINLHMNLRKGSLKDQLYLTTLPLLRQRKLRFVQPLLVGNSLRCCLAIEPHTILVGAKALQFPARRHTNLGPFACITTIRT